LIAHKASHDNVKPLSAVETAFASHKSSLNDSVFGGADTSMTKWLDPENHPMNKWLDRENSAVGKRNFSLINIIL
jgi:hypothetical protein